MSFDIGKSEDTGSFEPIPAGLYPAYVEKAEFKKSKSGAEYLNIMFKIFGEKYGNRVVFNIYNVMHDKEQVRNIAFSDLKKMFLAHGMEDSEMNVSSKEELLAIVSPVRVMLKINIKTDSYGTKNVITGYDTLDEKSVGTTDFNASDIPF